MLHRLAVLVLVAGCTVGAPPGFSGGDRWSFPLVGPLEDGLLVTPVYINDKGPYLMGIDPDAPASSVDEALVSELSLHNAMGPKMLDETDTQRPTRFAEVLALRVGTLTVKNRNVTVMKVGSFGAGGRQLRGMLGKDVIADSLVFGYDRERGVAYLSTTKAFTPPAAASSFGYDTVSNRLAVEVQPPGRRVAKIQIGANSFKLHVDLGAVYSQLRKNLWTKAGLQAVPVQIDMRDEVGTHQQTDQGAVANQVTAGNLSTSGVLFVPYADKRWEEEFVDGSVGLNFFRTTNVWAHWDAAKIYFEPRGDAVALTKERISRWKSAVLDACAEPGCIKATFGDAPAGAGPVPQPGGAGPGGAGAPVAPPLPPASAPVLTLDRDPSAKALKLEILVGAVGGDGRLSDLPYLVVHLPENQERIMNRLDPSYRGYKMVVLDVSPFPRACQHATGCIASLSRR